MQPDQINSSLQALTRQYPAIEPLPHLPPALAERQTFLGFTFTSRGSISSKCYFRPERDIRRLLSIIPVHSRGHFQTLHDMAIRLGAALYDSSLECTEKNEKTARAVWAIPYAVRQDDIRLKPWLSEFLNAVGFTGMSQPLLAINTALRQGLNTCLAPLYLIGGYIDPAGSISRLKISFDADCVEPESPLDRQPNYDGARTLAGLSKVMPLIADSSRTTAMMSYARRLLQAGYRIHLWGAHALPNQMDEFKIYFQSLHKSIGHEDQIILHEIMTEYGISHAELPPLVSHTLIQDSWKYWGFNLSMQANRIKAVKLYLTAS